MVYLHAEHLFVIIGGMSHIEVGKMNVDIAFIFKLSSQAAYIFIFRFSGVFNLLIISKLSAVGGDRFFFHHVSDDNEGVIGENLIKIVNLFEGVGCLVVFKEVDEVETGVDVPSLVVPDAVFGGVGETEGDGRHLF